MIVYHALFSCFKFRVIIVFIAIVNVNTNVLNDVYCLDKNGNFCGKELFRLVKVGLPLYLI